MASDTEKLIIQYSSRIQADKNEIRSDQELIGRFRNNPELVPAGTSANIQRLQTRVASDEARLAQLKGELYQADPTNPLVAGFTPTTPNPPPYAAESTAIRTAPPVDTTQVNTSTAPDDRYKNIFAPRSPGEVPGAGGSMDPRQQRLKNANLGPGGTSGAPLPQREVPISVIKQSGPTLSLLESDWRVRVSLAEGSTLFYKGNQAGIQSVLRNTNGVVFPYTPSISVSHNARYGEQKLTHSNYASYFYEGSDVSAITVQGEFTVQTSEEGKYLLAAVAFFRSCTKMFFGKTNDQRYVGSPPPIVYLHGYGKYVFPAVPCVITQFQHTMPGEVDYLEVSHFLDEVNPTGFANSSGQFKSDIDLLNAAVTRVPTSSSISVTLQPIYSRKTIHEDFNLEKFASGELLIGRGGFI